jgi:hypothetical protein
VLIPNGGHEFSIQRSVAEPKTPIILPRTPEYAAVADQLSLHPELALSRREIIKYILTPAGERAKDVQTLLRLDSLEKLRKALVTTNNTLKGEQRNAALQLERAEKNLRIALKTNDLLETSILGAVNSRRSDAGLEALHELVPGSIRRGIHSGTTVANLLPRQTALSEISATLEPSGLGDALLSDLRQARGQLENLKGDAVLLTNLKRTQFLRQGLEFADGDFCPLCDLEWSLGELKAHLQQKIDSAQEAEGLRSSLKQYLNNISTAIETREHSLRRALSYGHLLSPPLAQPSLSNFVDDLKAAAALLSRSDVDLTNLDAVEVAVKADWFSLPKAAADDLAQLKERVAQLPELSLQDEAKEFLVIANDRYDRFVEASAELSNASKLADLSLTTKEAFEKSFREVLEGIYKTVETDFTNYYSFVNRDDESGFKGQLLPSLAKLALNVDFYGRGLFPPGAYHSEGHQDAMGLCLYLALAKYTFGGDFSLAVLDDVLMSVDVGHRREVCQLLQTHFPKTQFVLTTHDQV